MIEYATVTAVLTDDIRGAQLINASGNLSSKNYTNVDILSIFGITAMPEIGDTVVIITMANGQYVCIGKIELFDLDLSAGEILLHKGEKTQQGQTIQYGIKAKYKINSDNELEFMVGEIQNSTDFVVRTMIKLDKDFKLDIQTKNTAGVMQGQVLINGQNITLENAGGAKIELSSDGEININ